MKKLLISVVVSAACLSFNANAALEGSSKFKFVGDVAFAGLCKAVVTDNVNLFKLSVAKQGTWLNASKSKALDILLDADNVQCAGKGLVEFSQARNAQNVLTYIQGEQTVQATAKATPKIKFVGDTHYASFCKAVVTNDLDMFKRAVASRVGDLGNSKQQVLDVVLDKNNVSCAGQGLVEFSQTRQAQDIVSFLSANKV
jgi:hypothetical protein